MNECQSLLDSPLSRTKLQKKYILPFDISLTIFYYCVLSSLFYLMLKQIENVSKSVKFSIRQQGDKAKAL